MADAGARLLEAVSLAEIGELVGPPTYPLGVPTCWKPEDRRGGRRLPLKTGVRLRYDWPRRVGDFRTRDISPSGLFVYASEPAILGNDLEVELISPTKEQIRVDGVVVRVEHRDDGAPLGGVGVRFNTLSQASEEQLRRLMEDASVVRTKPVPVAQVHFGTARAFAEVFKNELQRRRLFVVADPVRAVGTSVVVVLYAPQLLEPLALQGVVERAVAREEAVLRGREPGMDLSLTDLTPERLFDIELWLHMDGGSQTGSPAPPVTAT